MEQYKTCSQCSQKKSLFDFNKRASSNDGRRASCRECDRLNRAKYYESHERLRTPYADLPEAQKIKNREKSRAWNKANKYKRNLYTTKRRALQKNNGTFLVTEAEIKKIQSSKCFYCKNDGGEIDHV